MNTQERISYCVSSHESAALTRKIKAWVAARESEGWTVEFIVKDENGAPVVMWQCIRHAVERLNWREFFPCIGMDGREFDMN